VKIKKIDLNQLHNKSPFVSSYWAKLKEFNNWQNEAYLVESDGKLFEILVLYKKLIFNKYLAYVPFSPISIEENYLLTQEQLIEILNSINEQSIFNILFFRLDLPFSYGVNKISTNKFVKNINSIQPNLTVQLNLKKDISEIKVGYKKRAIRNLKNNLNTILIKEVEPTKQNIEIWYSLYKETAKRDNFQIRSIEYIKKVFISTSEIKQKLFFAYAEDEVVGGIIILYSKSEAIYLFGASKKLPHNSPSYSLQDFAIANMQKLGIEKYDFFGIGDDTTSEHLKSLTLFKSAFGGEKIERIPSLDYPINKTLYKAYKLIEKLRYFVYR
jgi:lipid II:glycine glycyltransferase (peptidoglycan interpeptide bridge formation enzyme)